MLRHGIRVGVAILTFTIGVAIFWPLQIIQRFETALFDRFDGLSDHDLRPVSLTFDYQTEANEIYRVFIQKKFKGDSEDKFLVLQSETIGYSKYVDEALKPEWAFPLRFNQMMKESMPEIEVETLSNYLLRNTTGEPLKVWNLGVNYVLATRNDLRDDGLGQFWIMFRKKFPKSAGLVSFSNVGFNKQHNQALIFAVWNCGETCGMGEYVLFEKVHAKWKIVKEKGLWIS